jgi:LacI family transcriptional regulator
VTIKDVAARAGVSVSAVSHVLNKNFHQVGPLKRDQILTAIRELDYSPNAVARSMAKKSTNIIGLVLNDLKYSTMQRGIIRGAGEFLQTEDYYPMLVMASDYQSEVQAIKSLQAQQVGGFIFMLSSATKQPNEHLLQLKAQGVPFVVINRAAMVDEDINQITLDDRGAGYKATKHLLSLNHIRIGIINGPIKGKNSLLSAVERYSGWKQALQEHKIQPQANWAVDGDYNPQSGEQAINKLLNHYAQNPAKRPTALFVAGYEMAVASIRALQLAGLKVPEDIAIVTVDDPPLASYTNPALTTLALSAEEVGRIAGRTVIEWIKAGKQPYIQKLNLAFTLQVRESCGSRSGS